MPKKFWVSDTDIECIFDYNDNIAGTVGDDIRIVKKDGELKLVITRNGLPLIEPLKVEPPKKPWDTPVESLKEIIYENQNKDKE